MSMDNAQYQPGDVVNGHQLAADGTAWIPVTEPVTAVASRPNWFVRHKVLTGIGALFGAVILISALASGGAGSDASAGDPASEEVVAEAAPRQADVAPEMTPGQANALRSAESYLQFSAFSEQGLIDQLSSEYGEQYSVEDATWAVSQLDVDWNEQAVRSAESYLEFSAFSRAGLIEQLSSPYGSQFTVEQATYAADALGL